MNTIIESLQAFRAEYVSLYVNRVTSMFQNMTPKGEYYNANAAGYTTWKNTVYPVLGYTEGKTCFDKAIYHIDADKLQAKAEKYADAVILEIAAKVDAKLGDLESASFSSANFCNFIMTGTRAGRHILINQNMIVNVSSKGTLFNQFPARIYVNGQSMSEAKYKKMFA